VGAPVITSIGSVGGDTGAGSVGSDTGAGVGIEPPEGVGAGCIVIIVGVALGDPGLTVGPIVVGKALGDPGLAVGPPVVG
jgi:hypothetical protein